MKYKLVIFDLDGTILDTLDDLTDSTNHALRINGLPEHSEDEIRRFVGDGIHKLIERAVPYGSGDIVIEKVFRDFNDYYKDHCFDKTKPYCGICECIENIKAAGIKIAVVSNKADYAVKELCDLFFPEVFDMVIGEKKDVRRKPYPDSIEKILYIMDIDRKEAVYVGDSEVDIKTAENAGIDEIAVGWGFRESSCLRENGAKIIVKDTEELYRLLTGRGIF